VNGQLLVDRLQGLLAFDHRVDEAFVPSGAGSIVSKVFAISFGRLRPKLLHRSEVTPSKCHGDLQTPLVGRTHFAFGICHRQTQARELSRCTMPFAVAAPIVVLVAGIVSAQHALDDEGSVYLCLPYEPECVLPPASTPLQPWPVDPLQYRKHIPSPPFLGARPPVPYVPPPSIERAPGQ
jgi:hypothetical protein